MNKQSLWNTWKKYRDSVEDMFMNGSLTDLIHIRDALSCSCLAGDEPVEGVYTNDKERMWDWLINHCPGFHSDFKGIDYVKNSVGKNTGSFSEALIRLQSLNFQDLYDDVFIWTQHAYDMYVGHWKW